MLSMHQSRWKAVQARKVTRVDAPSAAAQNLGKLPCGIVQPNSLAAALKAPPAPTPPSGCCPSACPHFVLLHKTIGGDGG
jgi:hypothetical protein